ncbi:MAG: carbohydrate binding domain-containing protein [Pseudomonadota bacterium]
MKSLKLCAIGGSLAMVLAVSPIAVADPAFEVAPVDQRSLPGSLLHNPMAIKWQPEGGNKSVSIVESEGVPGSQAISFRVRKKSKKPWDINMRAPFERDVAAGQTVEIFFWARASKLPRKKDTGKISVALGRTVEPYDTAVVQEIMPTSDWKMYRISGVAERDFPISESDMGFNFGFEKQTIELGPFFAITSETGAE